MNQHLLSLGKEGHDDSCNDEDYKNSTQSSCNEQCFQFQIEIMANYQKEGGYFQYLGRKNEKSFFILLNTFYLKSIYFNSAIKPLKKLTFEENVFQKQEFFS